MKDYLSLFLQCPSSLKGHNIIRGDFNLTHDPMLDWSTQIDTKHVQPGKALFNTFGVFKINWCLESSELKKREYSSCIDHFLISMELLHYVKKCCYSCIVISDHAAVSMKTHLGMFEHCQSWWLQTYLLQDASFVKLMEKWLKLLSIAFEAYIAGADY